MPYYNTPAPKKKTLHDEALEDLEAIDRKYGGSLKLKTDTKVNVKGYFSGGQSSLGNIGDVYRTDTIIIPEHHRNRAT